MPLNGNSLIKVGIFKLYKNNFFNVLREGSNIKVVIKCYLLEGK